MNDVALSCIRCHYPLQGLPRHKGCLTCPECGHSGSPADFWRESMRRRQRGSLFRIWDWFRCFPVDFWVWGTAACSIALVGGMSGGYILLRFRSVRDWLEDDIFEVWRLDGGHRLLFAALCAGSLLTLALGVLIPWGFWLGWRRKKTQLLDL